MIRLITLLGELGYDLWTEWRKARAKAKAWAETPAPLRACFRCREIAYVPGQMSCSKCGGVL